MTQTFEQVDPTTVQIGDNVRLDARMDKEFVASVRERGVLEPVLLYRAGDGTLTVLAGQRRTLAAQQCGQPTIPALVDDVPPAEVDRLSTSTSRTSTAPGSATASASPRSSR